jgi:hypothetical protein
MQKRKRSKNCERYLRAGKYDALSPLEQEIVREQLRERLCKDAPTREREQRENHEYAGQIQTTNAR